MATNEPASNSSPANDPANKPAPTPANDPSLEPVSFTAEQLQEANRIAEERAQRAAGSALKAYFQQQGMGEDEAKAALDAYKKQKAAEKTPEQLAQEAAGRVEAAKQTLKQMSAKSAAAQLGIKPERVEYAIRLADLSGIKVDDSMTVDQEAVQSALKAVLEVVPELAGTVVSTPAANPVSSNTQKQGIDAIRAAAGLKV